MERSVRLFPSPCGCGDGCFFLFLCFFGITASFKDELQVRGLGKVKDG